MPDDLPQYGSSDAFLPGPTGSERAEFAVQAAVAANMAEGVVVIRARDATIAAANRTFEDIFGYAPGELSGLPLSAVIAAGEAQSEETTREMGEALRDKGVWRGEITGRHHDGTDLHCRVSASLFEHHEFGTVWVAVYSDVTQERRLLAELQRSNAELEQFASVLAHDLTDPLRVASGYAELLSERYGDKLDPTARGFVAQISASTARMQRMLNTLRRYARLGGGELALEAVDSRVLVEGTLDVLRSRIEEAGAIVEVGRLPLLEADGPRLEQVFQNLIANGLKFASRDRPPVVRIEAEQVEADWLFSVTDNGIGLDPNQAERAFSLFGRLHADQFDGDGLGLAIVKKLIERHGGRIWVETVPAGGTSFRFTIPA